MKEKKVDTPTSQPEPQTNNHPMLEKEINRTNIHRLYDIETEFEEGFQLVRKYKKSVSIYGSSKFKEDNIYYKKARSLANRITKELNYTIVTGGGPGIMEAANRGAFEAGGNSVGLTIKLPMEQTTNKYLTDHFDFYYFFIRKVMLSFFAEAYVFFPGGYGTMDEFFELITLIQTRKIPHIPIILFGKKYWKPLLKFIENDLYKKYDTIEKMDLDIFTVTDDEDKIIDIIKNAPIR